MNTQLDSCINRIIRQMVEAGTPNAQAVAIGMAMEHALKCPEYAVHYGNYLVGHLQEFVKTAGTT